MSPAVSSQTSTGHLHLRGLVKVYDPASGVRAVDEVDLQVAPGEFLTLLGPSGCGKTTILRTIAGFEHPTAGQVLLDGTEISATAPHRRPVSMVFQSYALFPHMNVRENVGYGLRADGMRGADLTRAVDQALATMGLTEYHQRSPAQLSGGQQQRVALARAMVMRPTVMLFDEPLSNLDAALREQMRLEIRRLQRHLGITAVYVTHDQAEAMAMSDRVVVLNEGRIEQVGTPVQIYRRPASAFVASFVGRANMPAVRVEEIGQGRAQVSLWGTTAWVPAHPDLTSGSRARLLVRPESLRVQPVGDGGGDEVGPDTATNTDAAVAEVSATVFMGDRVEYELEHHGQRLLAMVVDPADEDIIAEGTRVRLSITTSQTWLLPS